MHQNCACTSTCDVAYKLRNDFKIISNIHVGSFDLENANHILHSVDRCGIDNQPFFIRPHKIIEILWWFVYEYQIHEGNNDDSNVFTIFDVQQLFKAGFEGDITRLQQLCKTQKIGVYLTNENVTNKIMFSQYYGLAALCAAWNGHFDMMVNLVKKGWSYLWCTFVTIERGWMEMFIWLLEYFDEHVHDKQLLHSELITYLLLYAEDNIIKEAFEYIQTCENYKDYISILKFTDPDFYLSLGTQMNMYKALRNVSIMKLFFKMVEDANQLQTLEYNTNECWQRLVCTGINQACLHSLTALLEFFCIKFNELTKTNINKLKDETQDHNHQQNVLNQLTKAIESCGRNEDIECILVMMKYLLENQYYDFLFLQALTALEFALKQSDDPDFLRSKISIQFKALLYQRKYLKLFELNDLNSKSKNIQKYKLTNKIVNEHLKMQHSYLTELQKATRTHQFPDDICKFVVYSYVF
jgi:hypothetical protein